MRKVIQATITIVLIITTVQALAQDTATERARRHYTEGARLFGEGNYQSALNSFRAAYQLVPRPAVLLSQAECHVRMGNNEEAIRLLEKYLLEAPNAPNAQQIRARIQTLSGQP